MDDVEPSRRASEVVGLYGDPDTTWAICAEFASRRRLLEAEVQDRAAVLVTDFPHLGRAPAVSRIRVAEWSQARERAAGAPFGPAGTLLRLLLDEDGHRLLVVAHHGACDGLGLLAIGEALLGAQLVSHARGIGDRPAPTSFLRSSVGRVVEAVRRPPPRFAARTSAHGEGEHLRVRVLARRRVSTVEMCRAVSAVFQRWNQSTDASSPLVVVGASRRPPGRLAPDRQTAYLRLRVDPAWSLAEAERRFREASPEPDFPETSAHGIGPVVARLLRSRLGATAQVSNLGLVEGPDLEEVAMFPAVSGPRAIAFGLASTTTATSVSLRTRAGEFSAADTEEILDLLVQELSAQPWIAAQ